MATLSAFPQVDTKSFSAIIEPREQMIGALLDGIPGVLKPLPCSLPVHCAEVVSLGAEFRAYVVRGDVRAVCQYTGSPSAAAALDRGVVDSAVRTLIGSSEGRDLDGCALDFALLDPPVGAGANPVTCLVEVNDGYSLGRYEGLSGRDYTDLLVARWQCLMQAGQGEGAPLPTAYPMTAAAAADSCSTASFAGRITFPQRFGGGPSDAPPFGSRNTAATVIDGPILGDGSGSTGTLFLGSFDDACDASMLRAHNVRTIVNCTAECELPPAVNASLGEGGAVVVLGLLDVETADLASALPRALPAMSASLAAGHSVLVHCAQVCGVWAGLSVFCLALHFPGLCRACLAPLLSSSRFSCVIAACPLRRPGPTCLRAAMLRQTLASGRSSSFSNLQRGGRYRSCLRNCVATTRGPSCSILTRMLRRIFGGGGSRRRDCIAAGGVRTSIVLVTGGQVLVDADTGLGFQLVRHPFSTGVATSPAANLGPVSAASDSTSDWRCSASGLVTDTDTASTLALFSSTLVAGVPVEYYTQANNHRHWLGYYGEPGEACARSWSVEIRGCDTGRKKGASSVEGSRREPRRHRINEIRGPVLV